MGPPTPAVAPSHKRCISLPRRFPFRCVSLKDKLIGAAQEGNLAECEGLLRDGVRVDKQTEESQKLGCTVLLSAARRGHFRLTKLLLDNGADVNARSSSLQTPLHGAAWNGHLTLAELLLQQGADLNAQSNSGQTPLHEAAWNGHFPLAKLLLEKGANANAVNKFGQSPLHWAAHYSHLHVAETLLQYGADITIENEDRETPLDKAKANPVKTPHRSTMVQLLQKSLTAETFLAVLFSKKHDVMFSDWHVRMVRAVHNVQELKIYYTVLKYHLGQGLLTRDEANSLVETALERTTVKLGAGGPQDGQTLQFRHIVAKCLEDGLIDSDTFNLYDNHTEYHSVASMAESVLDMKTAIKRNAIRISGLDGTYRSLQQNFQIYCRKTLLLQSPSTEDGFTVGSNNGNSNNRYPSAVRAKQLKTKIEATLGLVGVILNSIVMGYESHFLAQVFDRICEGIVDFGDPQHIESCIDAETAGKDVEAFLASYLSSFDMGISLAREVLAPQKKETSNLHIDEALRARDPLFVLGLASTMADPRILNDKLKSPSSPQQSRAASPHPSLTHSPRPNFPQAGLADLGQRALDTMPDFSRRSVDAGFGHSPEASLERSVVSAITAQAPTLPSGQAATVPARAESHPQDSWAQTGSVYSGAQSLIQEQETELAYMDPVPPASPQLARTTVAPAPMHGLSLHGPPPPPRSAIYYYENRTPSHSLPLQPTSSRDQQEDSTHSLQQSIQQSVQESEHSAHSVSSAQLSVNMPVPQATMTPPYPPLSPMAPTLALQRSMAAGQGYPVSKASSVVTDDMETPFEITHIYNHRTLEEEFSQSFQSLQSTIMNQFKDSMLPAEDETNLDLHAAVKYSDRDLLQELIEKSSNGSEAVNALDSKGRTCCDLAALTGQIEILDYLQGVGGSFAFKSGARMRAIARRRAPFVSNYHEMVESELEEA
jgi:ankyrin repeat protein